MDNDDCIGCVENIATVTLNCNHRPYCHDCFIRSQREGGNVANCPICRSAVVEIRDTRTVQHGPTKLADCDLQSLPVMPFGTIRQGDVTTFTNEQVLQQVRTAIAQVRDGNSDLKTLRKSLRNLTVEQYDLVFVELVKDQDLHKVLTEIDRRKMQMVSYQVKVKRWVNEMISSPHANDIVTRGVLTSAMSLATGNIVVLALFSGMELMRYTRDDISGTELAVNIGEHVVGNLAGFAGAYAGAAVGSMLGPAGTVVGGFIGAILGGVCLDVAGRLIYRKIVPRERKVEYEEEETQERQLTAEEVANKAAAKFNVSYEFNTFDEAQKRFRKMLLENHPDKHPNASPERKAQLTAETTDILACWGIVQEYYKTLDKFDEEDESESFIELYVLKVLDEFSGHWKTVRSFFADRTYSQSNNVNPERERLEIVKVYI